MKPSADDLPRIRLNRDNALAHLTAAQQEQLYDWLELLPVSEVLEKVAAPPPDGFGIKTHLTSLRRFHRRARAHFATLVRGDDEEDPQEDQAAPAIAPKKRTLAALTDAALQIATLHATDPVHFAAIARWALRLNEQEQRDKELELQKQRVEIERLKVEYNAARVAIIHASDLRAIIDDRSKDDEDKIMAARERIFGPRSLLIEPPGAQSTPSTPLPAPSSAGCAG